MYLVFSVILGGWIYAFSHSIGFCSKLTILWTKCFRQLLLWLSWVHQTCLCRYHKLKLLVFVNSGFISVGSFFILIISYIVIIFTVYKHSSSGSSKALSTLSAHVTVVVLAFGPVMFIYTRPSSFTHLDKFLSIFDAVVTPFLNPVIYTFRNQEMKMAMMRVFKQIMVYRQIIKHLHTDHS